MHYFADDDLPTPDDLVARLDRPFVRDPRSTCTVTLEHALEDGRTVEIVGVVSHYYQPSTERVAVDVRLDGGLPAKAHGLLRDAVIRGAVRLPDAVAAAIASGKRVL